MKNDSCLTLYQTNGAHLPADFCPDVNAALPVFDDPTAALAALQQLQNNFVMKRYRYRYCYC